MGVARLMPFVVDGGAIVAAPGFCVMVNGGLRLLLIQKWGWGCEKEFVSDIGVM